MKQKAFLVVAVLLLSIAGSVMFSRLTPPAEAQSGQPSGALVLPGVAASVANCAWPTGITVQNGMALCPTAQGLAYAVNGQLPFVLVATSTPGPAGPAGPQGPAGAIGPQGPAGTSAAQPTSAACANVNISAAGLTASSCTFK